MLRSGPLRMQSRFVPPRFFWYWWRWASGCGSIEDHSCLPLCTPLYRALQSLKWTCTIFMSKHGGIQQRHGWSSHSLLLMTPSSRNWKDGLWSGMPQTWQEWKGLQLNKWIRTSSYASCSWLKRGARKKQQQRQPHSRSRPMKQHQRRQ